MDDLSFMELAINEAKNSKSDLKVGAIPVKNGKVFSKGFRKMIQNIGIHAEERALNVTGDLSDCTLYLTLEPCFYRNNSIKSCCDLIIKSKVKKVVIGLKDITPNISGKAIEKLKFSGVEVVLFNKGLEKELLELLGKNYIIKHT